MVPALMIPPKQTSFSFYAVVFMGPTAAGKTALAHLVADRLRERKRKSELVNLDAFQFYKGFDAGTAKPTSFERKHYSYHCIDILEPHENIDANSFASLAHRTCMEIFARGNIPLCVGGSGLYLRAFLYGLDPLPPRDERLRARIRRVAEKKGWLWCHAWLNKRDPIRAAELHPHDGVRIERAIEILLLTGKAPSESRSRNIRLASQQPLFPATRVLVDPIPETLESRITSRISKMFEAGWIQEVAACLEAHGEEAASLPAMRAIGYRQVMTYLQQCSPIFEDLKMEQKIPPAALIEEIRILTRRYAKKQRNWCASLQTDATFITSSFSCLEEEKMIKNLVSTILHNCL